MNMWVDRLVSEYEAGRKELAKKKGKLNTEFISDREDKKHINSMINDMSESIEWMKTGRRPGNLRGIDKRSAYQRRALIDMDLFPSLDIQPEEKEISEEQKCLLVNILVELSHRERQCYLLHMAQGYSMREVAEELKVSKASVQKFIERAKNKINRKLSCHTNVVRTRTGDEKAVM